MEKGRIVLLDSFRCLAALSVVIYHYCFRWSGAVYGVNLYPYGQYFGETFKYGYTGIYFFFMISGFVISYTLENTHSLWSFLKNRLTRLFPAMLLCSVITYLVCTAADNKLLFPQSHILLNFLPSLSFSSPGLWAYALKMKMDWLSGSYWTLWVEMQFYFVAGSLYFLNKKKYFRNMLLLTVVISLGYLLSKFIVFAMEQGHSQPHILHHSYITFRRIFSLMENMNWFALGIIFFQLYKGRLNLFRIQEYLAISVIFLVLFLDILTPATIIYFLIMLTLFCLMINKSKYLSFLDNPVFRRIGLISYPLYLIHENIGVLLINKYAGLLGNFSPVFPFGVILLLIAFSELCFRYEKWAMRKLKTIFNNSN